MGKKASINEIAEESIILADVKEETAKDAENLDGGDKVEGVADVEEKMTDYKNVVVDVDEETIKESGNLYDGRKVEGVIGDEQPGENKRKTAEPESEGPPKQKKLKTSTDADEKLKNEMVVAEEFWENRDARKNQKLNEMVVAEEFWENREAKEDGHTCLINAVIMAEEFWEHIGGEENFTSGWEGDFVGGEAGTQKKVKIKLNEISSPGILYHAFTFALDALEKHTGNNERAGYIKKMFDEYHGPFWYCVVGKFGFNVPQEKEQFVLFAVNEVSVLLFRLG